MDLEIFFHSFRSISIKSRLNSLYESEIERNSKLHLLFIRIETARFQQLIKIETRVPIPLESVEDFARNTNAFARTKHVEALKRSTGKSSN